MNPVPGAYGTGVTGPRVLSDFLQVLDPHNLRFSTHTDLKIKMSANMSPSLDVSRRVLHSAPAAVQTTLPQRMLAEERLAEERPRKGLQRRRRHRREELGLQADARYAAKEASANKAPFLVLGFVTNPRTPHTREWIRETVIAPATAVR